MTYQIEALSVIFPMPLSLPHFKFGVKSYDSFTRDYHIRKES